MDNWTKMRANACGFYSLFKFLEVGFGEVDEEETICLESISAGKVWCDQGTVTLGYKE